MTHFEIEVIKGMAIKETEELKAQAKEFLNLERILATGKDANIEQTQNCCLIRIAHSIGSIHGYMNVFGENFEHIREENQDLFMTANMIINRLIFAKTEHTEKGLKNLENQLSQLGE